MLLVTNYSTCLGTKRCMAIFDRCQFWNVTINRNLCRKFVQIITDGARVLYQDKKKGWYRARMCKIRDIAHKFKIMYVRDRPIPVAGHASFQTPEENEKTRNCIEYISVDIRVSRQLPTCMDS